MSLKLSETNRDTIRQVYNLHATPDGRLDKQTLGDLFNTIGYITSMDELEEIKEFLFLGKSSITFEQFLKFFTLGLSSSQTRDIRQAYRILGKDDDKYIPADTLKKLIEENSHLSDHDICFIINQMMVYSDKQGLINYDDFLRNFRID